MGRSSSPDHYIMAVHHGAQRPGQCLVRALGRSPILHTSWQSTMARRDLVSVSCAPSDAVQWRGNVPRNNKHDKQFTNMCISQVAPTEL
jgi:hypothetical protein